MCWADCRDGAEKAKAHPGFDINHRIPRKIFFTAGKKDEPPFVSQILLPGQTGIMDRYCRCHKNGTKGINQTDIPVRVVGYRGDNVNYWKEGGGSKRYLNRSDEGVRCNPIT